MDMPVRVYALTWSLEDSAAIKDFQEANADKVDVVGWSRILFQPIHQAVEDPNIMGLAIDGILISNHQSHHPDRLKEASAKLSSGFLKLYACSSGMEPL